MLLNIISEQQWATIMWAPLSLALFPSLSSLYVSSSATASPSIRRALLKGTVIIPKLLPVATVTTAVAVWRLTHSVDRQIEPDK